MSIQKDLEGLINEALDAMETVREKLSQIIELDGSLVSEVEKHATLFVNANEALNDIYSAIENLDT